MSMTTMVEWKKTKAGIYRDRAGELRALADQLKCEEHKRLLLGSADNYERLAEGMESDRRFGSR
jgi:hypothetical protein